MLLPCSHRRRRAQLAFEQLPIHLWTPLTGNLEGGKQLRQRPTFLKLFLDSTPLHSILSMRTHFTLAFCIKFVMSAVGKNVNAQLLSSCFINKAMEWFLRNEKERKAKITWIYVDAKCFTSTTLAGRLNSNRRNALADLKRRAKYSYDCEVGPLRMRKKQ